MTHAAVLAAALAAAADPRFETVDVWQAGRGGYALYRIPGLVVTPKGALLAYCEGRRSARGDWGATDVLLRRSADGGKTWSEPLRVAAQGPHRENPAAVAQKLADPASATFNNPVAVADRRTGAVHLLFCVEYDRCFHARSDDDGVTFSEPADVTAAFEALRPAYGWKVIATGPGHGIQLRTGRLLVPVWLSSGTGGHAHRPSVVATVFSDDGGKSWRAGEVAAGERDPLTNPNESAAVELPDGRVMLNMRSESKEHRRAVAVSGDGATRWSRPAFVDALWEPVCMAGLCRLPDGRLAFSNPHNLDRAGGTPKPGQGRDRKNLTVKLSPDAGATWPVSRTVEPGPAGYSDLAAGPDGTVYCLFERGGSAGTAFRPEALTLAGFNAEWLSSGPK